MNFEFATAVKVVFGAGSVDKLSSFSSESGERPFVVTGADPSRVSYIIDDLASQSVEPVVFSVQGEPTIALVEDGVVLAKSKGCDHVISIGGGSAIDAGKAISALLTNDGAALDYLEVIGRGNSLERDPAPFIAVPTTAGTGAEVTRNAVLLSEEHKVKVSMRSPKMLPGVAVVDPVLTHGMSPEVTASTGLDALTQLIEGFVSLKASALTDGISREGILAAGSSLRLAYEDGDNAGAREKMSLASLFGGLVLANAGLGAVHGFAGPLGGMYNAPHGVICARLLPHVMKANIAALEERDSDSLCLIKYREVSGLLTGVDGASLQDGVDWVVDLCSDLKIPSLVEFGILEEHFPDVIDKARNASSMKGNPIALTDEELTGILKAGCSVHK